MDGESPVTKNVEKEVGTRTTTLDLGTKTHHYVSTEVRYLDLVLSRRERRKMQSLLVTEGTSRLKIHRDTRNHRETLN